MITRHMLPKKKSLTNKVDSHNSQGYYGRQYDGRHGVDREDDSLEKVKQHYWTAKQAILSKIIKKKEDEHLCSADAELDAKLEVYNACRKSCISLLRCIEYYQDYICDLSQAENSLGRFLKEKGKKDKTQAGKMMQAVGRAASFSAQQRLALRVPLVRLYQELDVFTERAVADAAQTVEAMEKSRTEYRGALLWLKNISEELDPDMYGRLEKFRKVQGQVKQKKARFDKYKLDCLQKTDLLSASRCNLFSLILANYQNCLLQFFDKTSKAHSAVAESFKGYQHFEFVIAKELQEPSRKLAELTQGLPEDSRDDNLIPKDLPEGNLEGSREVSGSLVNLLFHDSPEHRPSGNPDDAVATQLEALFAELDTRQPMENKDYVFPPELLDLQPSPPSANAKQAETASNTGDNSAVLPSQLLDLGMFSSDILTPTSTLGSLQTSSFAQKSNSTAPLLASDKVSKPTKLQESQKNWFNLFADIDPLKNPDSVGKDSDDNRRC